MHAPKTYRNPILPGMNPDPSITHVPGKGYYLCTSTFEFFPGLPIYHSPDMVHWTLIGHALNRRSQGVDMRTVEASGGLWAPTLRYNEKRGRWYVACTCFYKIVTEVSSAASPLLSITFIGKLTRCCVVLSISYRIVSCNVMCHTDGDAPQGDKPYMVEPTGFYVSTDDIHDDSKWSDAVYFEELGFDQDVSRPPSSPPESLTSA
jgi:beta-xylosidase